MQLQKGGGREEEGGDHKLTLMRGGKSGAQFILVSVGMAVTGADNALVPNVTGEPLHTSQVHAGIKQELKQMERFKTHDAIYDKDLTHDQLAHLRRGGEGGWGERP